jgi:hypothetical protein
MCDYCKKLIVTKPNLKKHLKICKVRIANNEKEISILKEKLAISEALNNKPSVVIGTQNNNTQININLTPWNKPKLPDNIEDYYKAAIDKLFLAVPTLIKAIHFNTDHPENHNICIKNERNNASIVYNGKEWETVDKKQLIDTLICDYGQTLEVFSDNNNLDYTEKINKIKKRDGEDKVYDDLHEEVKRVIYDRNYMIKIKK